MTSAWLSVVLACAGVAPATTQSKGAKAQAGAGQRLVMISITPGNPSVAAGLTVQFRATGLYKDGSQQDLTTQAHWSSSTGAATVSNTSGSQGLTTGVASGSTVISASVTTSSGTVTGSTALTVTPAIVVSITATPANSSVPAGLTVQYSATAQYSDQTTRDITAGANWASSNGAVASVSNATGSQGLATGVAAGSTTVSAAYQSTTGSTALTVTAPILQSVAITPDNASLALGLKLQYFATAQFSDHSTQDVTNSATWSASDVSVASVSNSPGAMGLASSVAAGSTSITATYQSVPGSTGLTVTPPAVQSVVVTPANGTLPPGAILHYSAMGHYTDGTIQDVTNSCTWASSSSTVAAISNTDGSVGLASAQSNGTSSISATYQAIVGSTNLAVANVNPFPAQLMGMSVNNPNFSPTIVGFTPWPTVPFGAFRLWDNGAAWHQLQPTPSTYTWEPLNGWLTFIRGHGITDIIYTFGSTPQWASSNPTDAICKYGPGTCYPPFDLNPDGTGPNQYWINFVAALARQGLGRIQYYQLWDTPKDSTHWKGTDAQLVRMSRDAYQTIKSIDPSAQILSPPSGAYHIAAANTCAIANREKPFFAAGGGPYVDIISFNSYFGSTPEDIAPALQCFQSMLATYQQQGKPWWNSEGSWGTATDLADPIQQAAFLARSYLLQVSFNVKRYYWYSWNNHTWGTLWDRNTGVHPAGRTYAQVYQWLVGATLVQPCTQDQNAVWSCVFVRPNGYQALALWTAGLSQPYQAPALYINSRDLSGVRTFITSGKGITVGSQPQLLENQ